MCKFSGTPYALFIRYYKENFTLVKHILHHYSDCFADKFKVLQITGFSLPFPAPLCSINPSDYWELINFTDNYAFTDD